MKYPENGLELFYQVGMQIRITFPGKT